MCKQNLELYFNQFFCVMFGLMMMREVFEVYRWVMGKLMFVVLGFVGWILFKINKGVQDLVKEVEINYVNRMSGKLLIFEEEVEWVKSVCELQIYEQWKRVLVSGEGGGDEMLRRVSMSSWNNLLLMKLLIGWLQILIQDF